MEGIVVSISKGVIKVEYEGVIYQTRLSNKLFYKKQKVEKGNKVILDPQSFLIIEVL